MQVQESEGVLQGAASGSELELELPLQPDKSKGHIKPAGFLAFSLKYTLHSQP